MRSLATRGPECTGYSYISDCQGRDRTPHACALPQNHDGKHACETCGVRFLIGDGQELAFARNTRTGVVHVLEPTRHIAGRLAADAELCRDGDLFGTLTSPTKTLCGQQGVLDGGRLNPLSIFDDRDMCASCVRALGIDAPRAFEHAVTGEPREDA